MTNAGMRILHRTTGGEGVYAGGHPDLQAIQDAIGAGETIRVSYSADWQYQISVVRFTTPDTGKTRWAYVSADPADAETRDFPTREQAEDYYRRDVQKMLAVGWVFDGACDVPDGAA